MNWPLDFKQTVASVSLLMSFGVLWLMRLTRED